MDKKRLEEIVDIGMEIGRKSNFIKDTVNRINLVKFLENREYMQFINRIMFIAMETECNIPVELAKFESNTDEFIDCCHALLMGIQNGVVEK